MPRFNRALIAIAAIAAIGAAPAVALASKGDHGGKRAVKRHGLKRAPLAVYTLRPTSAGPPLGACTPAAGSDSSSAFSATLFPLPPGGLSFVVSTANVPSSIGASAFPSAVDTAMGTWEGTQLSSFGGTTTTASAVRVRRDGVSTVSFARGKVGSAIGVTILESVDGNGDIAESDTILNAKYPWSNPVVANPDASGGCAGTPGTFDLLSVLTHELGHTVGLDHVNNDVQTMFPTLGTGETLKRTLAAGDTAGANTLY